MVADIMGWSAATAVRMVKRYGHIGPSARREAMAALDLQWRRKAVQPSRAPAMARPEKSAYDERMNAAAQPFGEGDSDDPTAYFARLDD